jgi:5-methylcytosine-specific restriction endonuclease McrA
MNAVKGVRLVAGREVLENTQAGREERRRRFFAVYERDHGLCCLCGQSLALAYATLEHLIPKGMGGSTHDDSLENLAVSHFGGNAAKGSQSMERYMQKSLLERIRLCQMK